MPTKCWKKPPQKVAYFWDKLYSWNRLVQKSGKSRWLWNSFSIWNSSSISMSSDLTKSRQEKLTSNKIIAISTLYLCYSYVSGQNFVKTAAEFFKNASRNSEQKFILDITIFFWTSGPSIAWRPLHSLWWKRTCFQTRLWNPRSDFSIKLTYSLVSQIVSS